MGRPTRPNQDLAALGRDSSRRYRLIRLDEGHKTAEVETEGELHLGDHVDVRGRRYEIVGLAWKEGREYLLCTPTAESHAADEPLGKERTWWSTDWRHRGDE
jgi:hypothetical protein